MRHAEREETAALEAEVGALSRRPCAACGQPLCGHEAVMSIALGFKAVPRCARCLAAALMVDDADLREHLVQHFRRRSCYWHGWLWASAQEGAAAAVYPPCLWPQGPARTSVQEEHVPMPKSADAIIVPDAEWDAGDMGCGDLVLELRLRVNAMPPGAVLRLTARDPGAPQDVPAWCGMTGHGLLKAAHPTYWIRRKEKAGHAQ